jgi:hypothetical protein
MARAVSAYCDDPEDTLYRGPRIISWNSTEGSDPGDTQEGKILDLHSKEVPMRHIYVL